MSDSVTLICVIIQTLGKITVFFGDCCVLEIFCLLVFIIVGCAHAKNNFGNIKYAKHPRL